MGPQSRAPTKQLFTNHDDAVTIKGETSALHPTEKQKKNLDRSLRQFLAGGLAGCAVRHPPTTHPPVLPTNILCSQAKTVVGPLDRVKILFQTSNPQFAKYTGHWLGLVRALRDISNAEGLRGLFRGHSATLLRIFPYAGIKFLAYEQYRAILIPNKGYETAWRRYITGSLAGVTSVFFAYPLEVIRVRLAFETKADSKSSLSRIFKQIYHEQPPAPQVTGEGAIAAAESVMQKAVPTSGLINFYRGFTPSVLGMLQYAGVGFLVHDSIGDLFRRQSVAKYTLMRPEEVSLLGEPKEGERYRRPQLTAGAELTAGGVAGLVSQTASYPLEIIRRRMQVGGAVGDGHRLSMKETVKRVFMERGWRGFFVGLSIGYVKVVPMSATSFFVWERGKWLFGID